LGDSRHEIPAWNFGGILEIAFCRALRTSDSPDQSRIPKIIVGHHLDAEQSRGNPRVAGPASKIFVAL
jgi:hypothetical protein